MDIMLQLQNLQNCELDVLSAANETLQELITDVENLLKNTEFKNSSELPEGMQVFREKSQEDLMQNIEYERGLSCQQPVLRVGEMQRFNGNNQEDFLLSIESKTGDRDELITNEQFELSDNEEQILYGNNHENSLVITTCRTGASLENLDHSIKEGQLFCLGSQEDFFSNDEYQIDINLGQSDSNSSEEQLFHQSNQDINLFSGEFIDASENNEDIDVVGMLDESSVPEDSPNVERISTNASMSSKENLTSDSRTESDFEDKEISIDSFGTDDDDNEEFEDAEHSEEFENSQPSEEIGDQEEIGNLDDMVFLERIVRFVRETDMMLVANQGAGDTVYDTDDDEDDDDFI